MKCIYCSSEVEDESKFCKYCGGDLKSCNNSENELEMFERAYIGSEYDSFKKKSFNVGAFFLGPLYLLYRKMYLISLIYILLYFAFPLVADIVLAFVINSIYLDHVKSKVKKIKEENPTLGNDSISEICKKKGGVSFTAPFIGFTIFFVFIIFFYFDVFYLFLNNTTDADGYEKGEVGEKIVYEYPTYFNGANGHFYSVDAGHSCRIDVETKKYRRDKISNYSENNDVNKVKINGNKWYLIIDHNIHKYITFRKGNTYIVTYTENNDSDGVCSDAFDNFKNSLKFVDISSTEA